MHKTKQKNLKCLRTCTRIGIFYRNLPNILYPHTVIVEQPNTNKLTRTCVCAHTEALMEQINLFAVIASVLDLTLRKQTYETGSEPKVQHAHEALQHKPSYWSGNSLS